ncbi:MAG: hypothetical protein JNJ59_14980 [Deltaproteobacteria bacterium]|nr:hypothetical protein [Deltaproteobacteria bacterium]
MTELRDLAGVLAGDLPMRWIAWPGVRATHGAPMEGPWPELVAWLAGHVGAAVSEKAHAPGWSPIEARDHRRADGAVSKVYALALDADDRGEWTHLLAALDLAGLAYFAHRSPSHGRDGACKWRIVLPLVAPVEARDWPAVYSAARLYFGAIGRVTFDPACGNPSRLWFVPVSLEADPPRETIARPGRAVDATKIPRGAQVDQGATRSARQDHARVSADNLERARAWMAKRDPAIAGAGGDRWTYATAAKLVVDFDLSDADAFELLREWNETCSPPWSERDLAAKLIHARKYGTHAQGEALAERELIPTIRTTMPAAHPLARRALRLAALHYQYLAGSLVDLAEDVPSPEEHLRYLVDVCGLSPLRAFLIEGAIRQIRRGAERALVGLSPLANNGLRGFLAHLGGERLVEGAEAAGLVEGHDEPFAGCFVFLWHDEAGNVTSLTGQKVDDGAPVVARMLGPSLPFGLAEALRLEGPIFVVEDESLAAASLAAGRPTIALGRPSRFAPELVALALAGRPAVVFADGFGDVTRARHLAQVIGAPCARRKAA